MQINPTRITGLATGIDTDSMVKQMLKPYTMKVDKTKQDKQIIQWRQELYRDILKDVGDFSKKYFDVLKKDTYMLAKSTYSPYAVEGLSGNTLSISAGSSAKAGEYKINVTKLAEGPKVEGTIAVNKVIAGEPNFGIKIDNDNKKFNIKIDGVTHDIEIKVDEVTGFNKYSSVAQVSDAINKAMSEKEIDSVTKEKLSSKVKAVVKDGNIEFMALTKVEENKKFSFTVDGKTYETSIAPGSYTVDEIAAQLSGKLSGLKSTTDGTTVFHADKAIIAETTNSGTVFKLKDTKTNTIGDAVEIKYDNTVMDIKISEVNPVGTDTLANTGINNKKLDETTTAVNALTFKKEIIKGFNDRINLRIGNEIKTLELTPTAEGASETNDTLKTKIEAALRKEITLEGGGTGDLVSAADLSVDITEDGKVKFTSTSGSQISIFGNGASLLGVAENFEVNMKSDTKMSTLVNENVEFRINGTLFNYDFTQDYTADTNPNGAKGKTIDEILRDIKTKANVDISYSESTKEFTLSNTETGANSGVYIEDKTGTFFKTIFGDAVFNKTSPLEGEEADTNSRTIFGSDAQFTLTDPSGNPTEYAKPKNSFSIDGVSYTLNGKTTGETTFKLTSNPDDAVKKIIEFVSKYNDMIEKIDKKISEKTQSSYLPLTDEQKKEMKEDEIKAWETKAKEGLLKGDSELTSMLNTLRGALFTSVKGVNVNLKEIGFDTSRDYTQKGKIVVDEDKLREALKNKGEAVTEFFSKQSETHSTYYSTLDKDQRKVRTEEEGIFQRINDILKDYARTSDGKGSLVKKAGLQGDLTDKKNTLTEYIEQKDKMIKEMERKMQDRENKLYSQFAQLEKAMNQMNAQSSWLMQQFGGGA